MADNVNIKDFSGASVAVMTDQVTHPTFGTGQVQVFKQMDGTPDSANMQSINAAGEALVVQNNQVSAGNIINGTLTANQVYTGTSEDVSNYAEIRVYLYSSHASATDGLSLQQSSNGTNWDLVDNYTLAAGETKSIAVAVDSRFFRVVYTNGSTASTATRLGVVYHKTAGRGSSVRPQDARTNEIDAEEVMSFNMVFNGTTWDRAQGVGGAMNVRQPDATASGSLSAAAAATTLTVNGTSSTAVQITGTFVGTLQFEGTVDGTNWVSFFVTPNGTAATVTSTTAPGVWQGKSGGFSIVRVRMSAYTSGTAVVTIRAGQGTGNVGVDSPARGTVATSNPATATNGAQANTITDKIGRQVVVTNHVRDMCGTQATTITSSTVATTVVAAGGAGVYRDLTNITITNSNANTSTIVTLSDGTVPVIYNVGANSGVSVALTTPRKATNANTAWTLQCGTSVASIYVVIDYVNNL